jgi:hypothetical protein
MNRGLRGIIFSVAALFSPEGRKTQEQENEEFRIRENQEGNTVYRKSPRHDVPFQEVLSLAAFFSPQGKKTQDKEKKNVAEENYQKTILYRKSLMMRNQG